MKQEIRQSNPLTRCPVCLVAGSLASPGYSLHLRSRSCCTCQWPAKGWSHFGPDHSRPDPGTAGRSSCGCRWMWADCFGNPLRSSTHLWWYHRNRAAATTEHQLCSPARIFPFCSSGWQWPDWSSGPNWWHFGTLQRDFPALPLPWGLSCNVRERNKFWNLLKLL